MTTEMDAMEITGLSLDEDDENEDISMVEELEESTDSSLCDGFTDIINEDLTSSTYTPSTEVSLRTSGFKNESKKKASKSRRRTEANKTINKCFIKNIDGTASIHIHFPGNNKSNLGVTNKDFYTTPDNKDDGNVSFSTKSRCRTAGTSKDGLGAKTVATSRALYFSDQVPSGDEELPKSQSNQVAIAKRSQSQIRYRHRKRRKDHTGSSVGKRRHGGGGHCKIENYLYIDKNEGNVIVGNNSRIIHEIKNDPGKAEEVEGDGSFPSISPKKSLKVTADENFETFMCEFQGIINCLHPLRDNGKYEEFYCMAENIAAGCTEPHIQILILIEKSMTLSYQKNFEESEKVIDEGIKMISKPGVTMKNFLSAYSHVHLTGLYRRQNKLEEANGTVFIAKQNEEFVPFSIARVFIVYEQASNLTKRLSVTIADENEPIWKNTKESARKSLREVISTAKRIHGSNSSIYLQRQHFSLIKLALMNLNCRTKASRIQPVKQESIAEAECCIKEMEECEGDMSEALSIQFYVAKCDLCFRKEDFLKAKHFAQQALGIATDNNFCLEIKPIEERVDHINDLLT